MTGVDLHLEVRGPRVLAGLTGPRTGRPCGRLSPLRSATFRHPAVPKDRDALIVGFGTPSPSGWPGALNALSRVLSTGR